MSDSYEKLKQARREDVQVRLAKILASYGRSSLRIGREIEPQVFYPFTGNAEPVTQPLDPAVYGFGIVAAWKADEDGRVLLVRYDDLNASDFLKVEAYELVDDPRSSFHGHQSDFWHALVDIPMSEKLSRWTDSKPAGVHMMGGGTTNPHKVSIAARGLTLAAFIAKKLDEQTAR